MTDFPSAAKVPSRIRLTKETSILKAEFGDGYNQRAADGLNNIKNIFELEWRALTNAEAVIILNFLDAQKGYLNFNWQHPLSAVTYKVFSERWSYSIQSSFYDINATFEQVFDL